MHLYKENRLQIRQNAIIGYTYTEYPPDNTRYYTKKQRLAKKESRKKAYSGSLTTGAKKRLTKSIELLCQTIKPRRIYNTTTKTRHTHRLAFITLTIHKTDKITAKDAYTKALSPFLRWMRYNHKVNMYIWKVEEQKRGQIHYHITTPAYIPHHEIKDKWNNLCSKAGWLNEYYEKNGHFNPNSTDIHSVRSVKNLSGYLLKEYCKSIQNPHTQGKVWDCSLNLKAYGYYTIIEKTSNNNMLSELIERSPQRVTITEFCLIINTKGLSQNAIMTLENLHQYDTHKNKIRTYKREALH